MRKLHRSVEWNGQSPAWAGRANCSARCAQFCKVSFLRVADVYTDRSIAWINCTGLKVRFQETFRARSGPCAAPCLNVVIGLAAVIP
ncbi:hypothetical protein PhaeoP78_00816 [Phaeobacter inhibens]|nr:hypothetical protein PhaeoP78_00816 [Phaeobacter inhibens]